MGFILFLVMASGHSWVIEGFDDKFSCMYVQSFINSHPYYNDGKTKDKVLSTECVMEKEA